MDEVRGDAARTLFMQDDRFAFDPRQAADADPAAGAVGVVQGLLHPLHREPVGRGPLPVILLLGGQLDETTFVDVQVEPEEVQPAETLQFPVSPAAGQNADLGALNWLIYLSLLIGLTALILGELPAPDAAELQKAIAASAELSGRRRAAAWSCTARAPSVSAP